MSYETGVEMFKEALADIIAKGCYTITNDIRSDFILFFIILGGIED